MSNAQKFGTCALIGLPNVGKSTLTNALVGSKISIVTRKVQTTRCRITGIMMLEESQIVLLDTPGVFQPKTRLEQTMVQAAWDAVQDTDIIIHIIDASHKDPLKSNTQLLEKIPAGKRCILVLNKVDKIKKEKLLDVTQAMNEAHNYEATFMISATRKHGVKDLKKFLGDHMPAGEWAYDPEDLTTMSMRFMAAEITREKIFEQLHKELPYSIFVETENWEEFDNGDIKIMQVIWVEKNSQKAIVLGRAGNRIKKIGESARVDISKTFDQKFHLNLFVKVKSNWADHAENLRKIGL